MSKEQKDKDIPGSDEATGGSTDESTRGGSLKDATDFLTALLSQQLQVSDKPPPEKLLDELTIEGVAKYIKENKCKNIITMTGAGISTSAGIPDFRSPGTGLYDNLEKYNLPNPQAVFSIEYFQENPEPFFTLARELWPGEFKPTPCHYFIRMLHDKGLLLRQYTQNIDSLEINAGLDPDKIVEAHGTFRTSHCRKCREMYDQDWMKKTIFSGGIPTCEKNNCDGVVKPDIVFFGESLPHRFLECVEKDFEKCDLLIILGTSLVVHPFASIVNRVPETTPRLYINLEKTGVISDPIMSMIFGSGFKFDQEDNYRDVFWEGTCDDGCYHLADEVGWGKELRKLVEAEHKKLDAKFAKEKAELAKENTCSKQKQETGGKL